MAQSRARSRRKDWPSVARARKCFKRIGAGHQRDDRSHRSELLITLEFPTELEKQIERAALARGTDAQAFIIEATRAAIEATTQATGDGFAAATSAETPAERRARISAAIDEAQKHFAPLMHGGDAVSQLMAEKRADVEREAERGL